MLYREDQRAGKKLSILGFGLMRLPRNIGGFDRARGEELINAAVEGGINYFDTAYSYPGNEEFLGTVQEKYGLRDKINIASKLPLIICRSPRDFDKFFSRELVNLRTNRIDYYLLHMITGFSQWQKLKEWGIENWLLEKKRSGLIGQAGFSFHGARDDFLQVLKDWDWDFCQIQYNYSDENFQAGITGLKAAHERGIPVIIMEPLLGGRLVSGLPRRVREIFAASGKDLSPAGWGLKWVWDHPEATLLLSGMSSRAQLEENLAVAETSPPGCLSPRDREVFSRVKQAFNEAYRIRCTGCNYCMPCPQNVNIPACFSAYNYSYAINRAEGIKQYTMSIGISGRPGTASLCVACGRCEKHCPQGLPIIDSLVQVKKRLEFPGYGLVLRGVRFWTGNRQPPAAGEGMNNPPPQDG
ncbi:MAG: aldo/keto reductase [Spirochaetales bacterium]|jgi:predicted aldo/keto reductase-like oxidoreductase|nr:aldo/keto reductase [Spirochaetales bacterium]